MYVTATYYNWLSFLLILLVFHYDDKLLCKLNKFNKRTAPGAISFHEEKNKCVTLKKKFGQYLKIFKEYM